MAELIGSAGYLAWTQAVGTILFAGDFRNFNWSPTMDFIDATAGTDTFEVQLPSVGRGQEFAVNALWQAGSINFATACAMGNVGSFVYGPEGNAATKIKYTIPSYAMGLQWNQVYNDVVQYTASFRQSGAHAQGTF